MAEGCVLRVFVSESTKYEGRPLYEWLVVKAKEANLASAAVFRGIMGFGPKHRNIQTFKIERLSGDLPVVVEIFGYGERLDRFLKTVDPAIGLGMVTREQVTFQMHEGMEEGS